MLIENKLAKPIIVQVEVEPNIIIPANTSVEVFLKINKITIQESV